MYCSLKSTGRSPRPISKHKRPVSDNDGAVWLCIDVDTKESYFRYQKKTHVFTYFELTKVGVMIYKCAITYTHTVHMYS